MKNHFLLFLLTAFIFGTSCRNDDDGDNDALSGYEKIVDKNWRLTGAEVRANGIILANRSLVFDCERDNVTRYEEFYFWTLISNDAKLILDYGGPNVQVYNNIVNDGRNLVLERFTIEDVDNDGTQESVQTRLTYARS